MWISAQHGAESNCQLEESLHPPHQPSLHPYLDLQVDLLAASVAVDHQDLRQHEDDAALRLRHAAIEGNFVHRRLEDEKQISIFLFP